MWTKARGFRAVGSFDPSIQPESSPFSEALGALPENVVWAGTWLPRAGSLGGPGWHKLGIDLEDVATGYYPDWWNSEPVSKWFKNPPSVEGKEQFVDSEITRLFKAGHIVEWSANTPPIVVNPLLVVEKPGVEDRLCVNFRYVNSFIARDACPLPQIPNILERLERGMWIQKLDLKAGYHQVRARKDALPFLAFAWKGRLFSFTVLAFGLADAPRRFQRITSSAQKAVLRKWEEVEGNVYLDDFIHFAFNPDAFAGIDQMLESLGFVLGLKKCLIGQDIEILGFKVDSRSLRITVAPEKWMRMQPLLQEVITANSPLKFRTVAKLLGKLNALETAIPQVALWAKLLAFDVLDKMVEGGWRQVDDISPWWDDIPWDAPLVTPSLEARNALKAFAARFEKLNGRCIRPIAREETWVVETDASPVGGGGLFYKWGHRGEAVEWAWQIPRALTNANVSTLMRETWALTRFVKSLPLTGRTLIIVGDNVSLALGAIKKGSKRCRTSTEWLLELTVHLTDIGASVAESWWITSKDNQSADEKSRGVGGAADLRINPQELVERAINPQIDLMASQETTVAERWVSWLNDSAVAKNFFLYEPKSSEWTEGWLFPPPRLARRAVHHIQSWHPVQGRTIWLVLPDVYKERWLRLLQGGGSVQVQDVSQVRVTPPGTFSMPDSWRFRLYRLSF